MYGFDVGQATLVWIGIALYFLPTLVAFYTGRGKLRQVVLVNVFLGWTLVGWIVALVLATKKPVY